MKIARRKLIHSGLFGAGYVGLRALATGIPAKILLDPLSANAQSLPTARALILATNRAGPPINANCPGTYVPGVAHSDDPLMAPVDLRISAQTHRAAAPWATLDQSTLDKTCFFHHSTKSNSHAAQPKVMRVLGKVDRNEMYASLFAADLGARRQTTQAEPIALGASGNELLSFEGRVLARLQPSGLRDALTGPTGLIGDLQSLRDRDLDRMHNIYKNHGTAAQRAMLDRFARTHEETRGLSDDLVAGLSGITGNDELNQVRAAAMLIKMNVTSVVSVRIKFGGDNHSDGGLARETAEHVSGIGTLAALMTELRDQQLEDDVVVASMNVFGRTLAKKGTNGRDHNPHHHVTFMMGSSIRGSVVGGVEPRGNDWGARGIDATTGMGGGTDIPVEETLGSAVKTLGAALGVQKETLDKVAEGQVVQAAIV